MRAALLAFLLDATLVFVFAAAGRASHTEGLSAVGVLQTAWPFLSGLLVGWIAVRLWRRPGDPRLALPLWLITVAVGLVLRVVSGGGGAPLSFVAVATVILGAFLVGWRCVAGVTRFAVEGLHRWSVAGEGPGRRR